MEILKVIRDLKTKNDVIYATLPIYEYLEVIGDKFLNFSIQRRRVESKAYERLEADLKEGSVIPPITLSVKHEFVDDVRKNINDPQMLSNILSKKDTFNILDGLQRTFILKDLQDSSHNFSPEHKLILEIWPESNISRLIYRIIVLNSGQKKMSLRHQIELLFLNLKEMIESTLSLEIYLEKEESRRTKPGKYSLEKIVLAYQCFLTSNFDIQKENLIAQQLMEQDITDLPEKELNEKYNLFLKFFDYYAKIDNLIVINYPAENDVLNIPSGLNWIGSENVINSFFAAVGFFANNNKMQNRITTALDNLLTQLIASQTDKKSDVFGLEELFKILKGLNARKINLGSATRKILFQGFKEFIRESGDTRFSECWKLATE